MADDDPVSRAFRRAVEDRHHGAAEIERRLLSDLLALRARWTREGLSSGAALLADGQPAMVPLTGLASRIAIEDPEALSHTIRQRLSVLDGISEMLAVNALRWIVGTARLVTISRSSAVASAVKGAWQRGWGGKVVVLEGTSAGRGDEQARELAVHGPAVSAPDADAPRWLDPADTVVAVGADAIGSRRFVNCVGTRSLLELAAVRDIPRLLVADRGKDAAEEAVGTILGRLPVHRDAHGREWQVFESVPLDLVTMRISE